MRTFKTAAAAWRHIAREFSKYADGAPRTVLTRSGLCWAQDLVRCRQWTCKAVDVYHPLDQNGFHRRGFWWPLSRKQAANRAAFAMMLSLEADTVELGYGWMRLHWGVYEPPVA